MVYWLRALWLNTNSVATHGLFIHFILPQPKFRKSFKNCQKSLSENSVKLGGHGSCGGLEDGHQETEGVPLEGGCGNALPRHMLPLTDCSKITLILFSIELHSTSKSDCMWGPTSHPVSCYRVHPSDGSFVWQRGRTNDRGLPGSTRNMWGCFTIISASRLWE